MPSLQLHALQQPSSPLRSPHRKDQHRYRHPHQLQPKDNTKKIGTLLENKVHKYQIQDDEIYNALTFVSVAGGVAIASSENEADPSTTTPLPSAETPLHKE